MRVFFFIAEDNCAKSMVGYITEGTTFCQDGVVVHVLDNADDRIPLRGWVDLLGYALLTARSV